MSKETNQLSQYMEVNKLWACVKDDDICLAPNVVVDLKHPAVFGHMALIKLECFF